VADPIVKDLMVPLEEYVTVDEEATLYDAVMALEKAQEDLDRSFYKYLHRAILVLDVDKNVVGKISQLDVLCPLGQAVEPNLQQSVQYKGKDIYAYPDRRGIHPRRCSPWRGNASIGIGSPPILVGDQHYKNCRDLEAD